MNNLSAESFPEDSIIIQNVSSATNTMQQPSSVVRKTTSTASASLFDIEKIAPTKNEQHQQQQLLLLSLPSSFIPNDNIALSLSPESMIDISCSASVSTSSSSSTTASVPNTNKKPTIYLKSNNAAASAKPTGMNTQSLSGSNSTINRNNQNKLSKKSASVDSLHHRQATDHAVTVGSGGRRTTRYDHVQSKVKASIETLRQEDHRRRNARLERHRSMPESLSKNQPTSDRVADTVGSGAAAAVAVDFVSVASQTLAKLRDELAEKDNIIRQMCTAHENNVRDNDAKLKLERKVELMRLELMQAKDERLHYQKEVQQLLNNNQMHQQQEIVRPQQQYQQILQTNSCSTSSSSSCTASSSVYPPSSSTVSYLTGIGEITASSRHNNNDDGDLMAFYEAASTSTSGVSTKSAASSKAALMDSVVEPTAIVLSAVNLARSTFVDRNNNNAAGVEGLYHRRSAAAYKMSPERRSVRNDDDDDELLLFNSSDSGTAGRHHAAGQYAIITSSSTSQELLAMHDDYEVVNNGIGTTDDNFNHTDGIALQNLSDCGRRKKRSQRRRIGHELRKRIRRLLRKCAPCLDGRRRENGSGRRSAARGSDENDGFMATASFMYAPMENYGDENDDNEDDSVATATTGCSSFN